VTAKLCDLAMGLFQLRRCSTFSSRQSHVIIGASRVGAAENEEVARWRFNLRHPSRDGAVPARAGYQIGRSVPPCGAASYTSIAIRRALPTEVREITCRWPELWRRVRPGRGGQNYVMANC
jgi:hypothetical protein